MEVLEGVLNWLPLTDIVACRHVSRAFHAAVEGLVARDRPFAYQCGYDDLVLSGRSLAAEGNGIDVDAEGNKYILDRFVAQDVLKSAASLPCTCGALQPPHIPDAHDMMP